MPEIKIPVRMEGPLVTIFDHIDHQSLQVHHSICAPKTALNQLGFSYFEFKIRLIRLGLSFQKQNFLYSNSQPSAFQAGVITITPKNTVSGRHRRAFSNLQSCLTDSSWIHLFLLIQLIYYKIKKHEYFEYHLLAQWNVFLTLQKFQCIEFDRWNLQNRTKVRTSISYFRNLVNKPKRSSFMSRCSVKKKYRTNNFLLWPSNREVKFWPLWHET